MRFAHDQLGATGFVELEVKTDITLNHLALACTHTRHFDGDTFSHNSELWATARQLCHFCAVYNIFARHAGNIGARSSDQLPLDHGGPSTGFGHRPRKVFARLAATDDK